MEKINSLINAQEIPGLANKNRIVFIDARGGADAKERYQKGHLAGAHFVDLESDLSDKGIDPALGGRHPLPTPEVFGVLLGRLGITPDTHVIVYDDKSGAMAAARFWWMLKSVGHKLVQVVNGGLNAIKEAGFEINGETPELNNSNGPYPTSRWQLPTVTIDELEKVTDNKEYIIIDVRENYRYRGEREPIDLVAGHIPGAQNVPYLINLDDQGRFLSSDKLAQIYNEVVKDRDTDKVIVHCGSGVTACHTLLAMDQAGIMGASLYVGSWSEWSRTSRPIAKEV